MTVDDMFKQAVGFFEIGRVGDAVYICQNLLKINKNDVNALHLLGCCYMHADNYEVALSIFDGVLILAPKFGMAHYNRGLALKKSGKYEESLASFKKVVSFQPDFPSGYSNIGAVLNELDRPEEAIEACVIAVKLDRGDYGPYNNIGESYRKLGNYSGAISSYDRAINIAPLREVAHYNKSLTLKMLGLHEASLLCISNAIKANPGMADFYNIRGELLCAMRRHEEALASYNKAIVLKKNESELFGRRGNVLLELRRYEESLACFDKAIEINPGLAENYGNRGNVLRELGQHKEALENYDKAIAIKPDSPQALTHKGGLLEFRGQYAECLKCYEMAFSLCPDEPYLLGSLLHTKMNLCDWSGLESCFSEIARKIDDGVKVAVPFALVATPISASRLKRCAEIFASDKFPPSSSPVWQGQHYAHDRIRIGYYSADLHNHATAHLITEFIERHDRSRFEIFGFSFGPSMDDSWNRRLRKSFNHYFDLRGQSDKEIAALSCKLEIDIAIDLKGFTKESRPGIFAMRAAPVQVNYLGYPGTMGADYMDYLIADPVLIPDRNRSFYSEKMVYLPHTYQPNDSTKVISELKFSRRDLGLPDNAFVFCCFNANYKITPDVFDIWMRLLLQVEDSVLWLFDGRAETTRNLRMEARNRGVSPDRLVFAPRMELSDHLARHRLADLFLDTFYCNAHTTASDALWAGLPILTCPGESFAGRVAASLLSAIGLTELISDSHEEYEAMALALATDANRLAIMRAKLAERRAIFPLFDTARFARNIEAAYTAMWKRNQAGLPPETLYVQS